MARRSRVHSVAEKEHWAKGLQVQILFWIWCYTVFMHLVTESSVNYLTCTTRIYHFLSPNSNSLLLPVTEPYHQVSRTPTSNVEDNLLSYMFQLLSLLSQFPFITRVSHSSKHLFNPPPRCHPLRLSFPFSCFRHYPFNIIQVALTLYIISSLSWAMPFMSSKCLKKGVDPHALPSRTFAAFFSLHGSCPSSGFHDLILLLEAYHLTSNL